MHLRAKKEDTSRDRTGRLDWQIVFQAQRLRSFFGVSLPINFFLFLSARLPHKRQTASRNAPSLGKEFLPLRKAAAGEIGFGRSNRVLFVSAEKTTINIPLYGRQLRLTDGLRKSPFWNMLRRINL